MEKWWNDTDGKIAVLGEEPYPAVLVSTLSVAPPGVGSNPDSHGERKLGCWSCVAVAKVARFFVYPTEKFWCLRTLPHC
jgi:hypothetical protein